MTVEAIIDARLASIGTITIAIESLEVEVVIVCCRYDRFVHEINLRDSNI